MSRMITQSLKTIRGIDLKTPPLIEPPPRTTLGSPPEMITVASVWWGTKYSPTYLKRLYNSVARNLTIPYEFVCLTTHEVPDGVKRIKPPLNDRVKTWWQKLGLFAPGLFEGRVLYLDLDLVVVGSLDKIASVQEDFCMIENFSINKRHCAHNSSVMVWTPSEQTERIYTHFSEEVMRELHGDQCFLWRIMNPMIWNFPQSWTVSYKYEKYPQWRHANKDTSIYVFHGDPKPASVKDKIIVDNWK